jgi:hypothetical protein
MGKKYFSRLRRILSINGWRPIIAIVSAFTIIYLVKYFIDYCLSNEWSWISVILIFSTLACLYNNYCQANDIDAKNALIKDWCDLPLAIHLIIILSGLTIILILVFKKYILEFFSGKENDIRNIKLIAYGNKKGI